MSDTEHLTPDRIGEVVVYADGGGTEEERRRIGAHIDACPACKAVLEEELALQEELEGLDPNGPISPELAAREGALRERLAQDLRGRIALGDLEAARAKNGEADVIPIERGRLRRLKTRMVVGWTTAAASMAATATLAVRLLTMPAVAPAMPVVAQKNDHAPDHGGAHDEQPPAMASAGPSPTEELSRAQSRLAFDLEQSILRRLMAERDDFARQLEKLGVPPGNAKDVANYMVSMAARDAVLPR